MKNITVSQDEQGFWVALLDMPGRPFNVFSEDMMADLEQLIEQVLASCKEKQPPRGLIVSSGKSSFVAGADLGMIQDFGAMRFRADWQQMRDRYSHLGKLFRRLEQLPLPVVAAVNGLALGGGLELAMACHARVCVDAPHAQLGLPEILLGLLPGAGGTQRLPRYIGVQAGIDMLLSGEATSPQQALAMGLVNELASADELLEVAKKLAGDIAAGARWDAPDYRAPAEELALLDDSFGPQTLARLGIEAWDARLYPALNAILRCVKEGYPEDIDRGSDIEWDIFVDLMSDPVASNMVTTCFLNKTAATKRSMAGLPKVAQPASYALAGDLTLGKKPFRKVPELPADEAELVISPLAADVSGAGLLVRDLLQESNFEPGLPELRIVGEFAATEVLELVAGEDATQTARAATLLVSAGKPLVVSGRGDSISERLFAALRDEFATSGMEEDEFLRFCAAVGLQHSAGLALRGHAVTGIEADAALYDRALALLARLSLQCHDYAAARLSGDAMKDSTMLAATDLLAVYVARFPKWTGGPLSCLAMFQRGELDAAGANAHLQGLAWRFKDAAGYAPVAQ